MSVYNSSNTDDNMSMNNNSNTDDNISMHNNGNTDDNISMNNNSTANNDNTSDDNAYTIIKHNRFQPNSKYFTIMLYGLAFVLGSILLVRIVGSFNNTVKLLGQAIDVIAPFLVGAFIAFILYPLVRFFYRRLFKEKCHMKSDRLAKWLSILVTYAIAIGIIAVLLVFILPQLYTSITDILDKLPVWYNNVTIFITDFEKNHKDLGFIDYNIINEHLTSLYPKILSYLTDILTNILPYVVNTSMAIIKGLINLIISVMVSVYMISDHKNIFYQFKRLLYAVFPKQAADTARTICRESANIFRFPYTDKHCVWKPEYCHTYKSYRFINNRNHLFYMYDNIQVSIHSAYQCHSRYYQYDSILWTLYWRSSWRHYYSDHQPSAGYIFRDHDTYYPAV